ncbi:30S ribosomal protein S9 [candidate division WOR-3 bacterium]|uniref:Small ribosomal subunit protein uS9 n=1 Tax=candidate division TA06 bacterium TaxID=2250710 RepID=A0A660S5V6_UNCT6|nr:30S ribosomal protein S9 [candidate division WOR-3 bacterium]RKX65170.1 MAG: 30S ribosomal protein S9 [candidate division TA06 bacterium]
MTEQIRATGRRKEASVSVILRSGNGKRKINGKSFEEYFGRMDLIVDIEKPFKLTNLGESYDVIVNAKGGGIAGQADAIKLGIARALIKENPELKKVLKQAGFLTRDQREKERKKYGLKKARKAFQFSKR